MPISKNSQPNITVSYARDEELDGTHKQAVESFCKDLIKAGANVIRDVDSVKPGECLSTFMRTVGASNFLCVFLSDSYLKSANCMYELSIAWQRSKDNPEEFRQRVKVWVMPGSASIREPEHRLLYTTHWRAERDRVQPLIEKFAVDAPGEVVLFRRIREIAENVNDMLVFFSTSFSVATVEEFQKWIADQIPIPPAITTASLAPAVIDATVAPAVIDAAELAAVYENTTDQIEEALNQHVNVSEFLRRAANDLVQRDGEIWKLSTQVRSHNTPVVKTLEAISKKISTFTGNSDDWKCLGEIAGGLVILGIDREWIVRQRQAARRESVEYPSDEDIIRLGEDRQANLLHLICSALADGRARLEKVFGKPPVDEHLIPNAPQLLRGITEDDRNHAVKLHFIRYILGPDQQIDAANKKKVDILFKRTKDVITSAFADDHVPYVATGPSFKNLIKTIREHLQIEDLLIIHPSGDDPEKLLQDNVRVLKFLGNIFDTVNANMSK